MTRVWLLSLSFALTSPMEAQVSRGHAEGAGMELTWTTTADRLEGELRAPTEGWVLVGFNRLHEGRERGLPGARLFFFAVDSSGTTRVEEHIADPPSHAPRARASGEAAVRVVQAERRGSSTHVRFSLPLGPVHGSDVALEAGAPTELILAYSVSDDFDHHSRRRVHRRVEL